MASASTLPNAALQASKAALSSALAENQIKTPPANGDVPLEDGEIQEVDMQAQADNIRTVFNDPKNFNVKVRLLPLLPSIMFLIPVISMLASFVLPVDALVRFSHDQRSQSASDTDDGFPPDATAPDPRWAGSCSTGLDGRYQTRH